MSGHRPAILVTSERNTVLACAVEALGRFPTTQPWVLIGGVAVFLRLGSITRPTDDADPIARSQAELIRQLVADEITTVVTGGYLQDRIGDGVVEIDVRFVKLGVHHHLPGITREPLVHGWYTSRLGGPTERRSPGPP